MKKPFLYIACLILIGCSGSGGDSINPGTSAQIATKIFSGRTEYPFDNSTPKTFRTIFSLAQHADAVRVIFAHSSNVPIHISKFSVAALSSASNFALNDITWTDGKIDGADGQNIPASPSTHRRTFLISDWVKISTIVRTDDPAALPLLAVAAYIDTPSTIVLLGKSTGEDSFTNWATHPTRPHVMRYNDGDCVTSPSNFTDQTNRSTSPIVGIQYIARGQVITVFAAGDSITEGRGTYLGGSWAFQACDELSNIHEIAYEYGNISWAGVGTALIRDHVLDTLSAGLKPDILFLPAGSPNDVQEIITDDHVATARTNIMLAADQAAKENVVPIFWTWLPSNSSIKSYGATDSRRRAYNDEILGLVNSAAVVVDFDSIIAGIDDGTGQTQMASGTTNDGIHPNDFGERLMVPLAKQGILDSVTLKN